MPLIKFGKERKCYSYDDKYIKIWPRNGFLKYTLGKAHSDKFQLL